MSKTERLMTVLGLVRDRGPVSLQTIASECGISPRTVYRYIESLQKLHYPVYFDDGYRMRREVALPATDLSPDEIALIRFCLRNNPFLNDNYFVRQFERIDRKLGRRLDYSGERGSTIFESGRDTFISDGARQADPLLERFTDAIVRRRQVRMTRSSMAGEEQVVTPVSIRLKRGHVELVYREGNSGRTHSIVRDLVASMQILEPQAASV